MLLFFFFLENIDDIVCPNKGSHGSSCTQCTEGFVIFIEMKNAIKEKEEAMVEANTTVMQKQQLDQLKYDVQARIDDLCEYRGHLARHVGEEEKAMDELDKLLDDEAFVTSDYKMKKLACFFRENQRQWFGKSGIATLGFIIVTNPKDEESKAKQMKDVTFVMLVTNDGMQDDRAVACAKSYIYKECLSYIYRECLSDNIKKVIFVTDGAGYFKSKLHRAIQGMWKIWTGIDEIKYQLTPAGSGKTCLDGMFGRMSIILSSTVDNGSSYFNMESILNTLSESNGMSSTRFIGYAPDRTHALSVELADKNTQYSLSILTTILDPESDCNNSNNILSCAFKHSGYGSGQALTCSYFSFHLKTDKKKQSIPIYDKNVSLIFYFVPFSYFLFVPFYNTITVTNTNIAIISCCIYRQGSSTKNS